MKIKMILLLLLLTFGLVGCGEGSSSDKDDTPVDNDTPLVEDDDETIVEDSENTGDDMLSLTLEQLSIYDGKDGNEAYIAVNGIIYNVTNVSAWNNGTHNGASAGNDVSSFINGAPHGDSVLSDLEVVGELVD